MLHHIQPPEGPSARADVDEAQQGLTTCAEVPTAAELHAQHGNEPALIHILPSRYCPANRARTWAACHFVCQHECIKHTQVPWCDRRLRLDVCDVDHRGAHSTLKHPLAGAGVKGGLGYLQFATCGNGDGSGGGNENCRAEAHGNRAHPTRGTPPPRGVCTTCWQQCAQG